MNALSLPNHQKPSFIKKVIFRGVRIFGAVLTSFSLAAFIYSFTPVIAGNSDKSDKKEEGLEVEFIEDLQPGIKVAEEAHSYGVNSYFSVVIPSINAYSNIIANVDPFNKEEYQEALKKGVAHAKGTYFPTQGKTIYLFAHSTDSPINIARFNAVFYSLKDLQDKDSIIIYYKNHKFIYKVIEKIIVDAKDTFWLQPKNEEELILQTCYPPGTRLERLLVRAKRLD